MPATPTQRKVPVCLPHDEDFLDRYRRKHGWSATPDPIVVWLDPDTQVIVERAPSDELQDVNGGRVYYRNERMTRPGLGDLDAVTIEPHRRRFPDRTKLWQARLSPDVTINKTIYEGQPDARCPRCRRLNRNAKRHTWPKNRWRDNSVHRPGCSDHVKTKRVEVPHPKAGEVFAVFSTFKLYGLAPGTHIIYQGDDDKWVRAVVHEYELWKAVQRGTKKAKRKAANEHRRYMRQPAWYERVSSEDDWI